MKVFVAAVFFLMTSCAGWSSIRSHSLVGEWLYADRIQSCHYVFNNNGRFSGEVVYQRKRLSEFKGRWSVEGATLRYEYSSDALGKIPIGTIDRDKLVRVEKNFFVIEAADGSERKYKRIR